MTYRTNDLLAALHADTEAILDLAIQSWQLITPSRLGAQPKPGSWSAAQCLDHLNGYGDYYLPLLEKAILTAKSASDYAATFTPGYIGAWFTRLMKPLPDGDLAKKMKAPRQHIPPVHLDSDKVLAAFIEQQEQLLSLLDLAKDLNLNHRSIPISIFPLIRLKTGDTLSFLIAHNQRHTLQAQKALQSQSELRVGAQAMP